MAAGVFHRGDGEVIEAVVFVAFLLGYRYSTQSLNWLRREASWAVISLYCLLNPRGHARFLRRADQVAIFKMLGED